MPDPQWDSAALRGVAANPSAPVSVLMRLPDRADVTHALLEREHVPPRIAAYLARYHPDADVRRDVAGHPSTPADVLARLATDAEVDVRAEVARNRRAPAEVRASLADDPDPEVRRSAAFCPLPAGALHRLLRDPDRTVRTTALMTASVTSTTIPPETADLFDDDPDDYHRAEAIALVELTPALIARYRHHRAALARNPTLPPGRMPDFLDEGTALARNPNLPATLLETLVDTVDPEIHRELLRRTDLPDHLRRRLAAASEEDEPLPEAASLHPGRATLDERLSYLDHPNPAFRRTLTRGDDLPADAVHRLARDPDWATRLLVCERFADVPPDVVVEVAEAQGGHSGWDLFRHPRLPADAVARNAAGDDPVVRHAIATRPDLPPDLARRLLADGVADVRRAAAANPALPVDRIRQLLADADPHLREGAASNPALPVEDMRRVIRPASGGPN